MDTQVATPTPTPAATPAAAPITPPQVNTATAATGTVTPPESSGNFKDSFKKALSNPVQIGFGMLGTALLFYCIYYLQWDLKFRKNFVKTVENKIDDLDMKYADILSKLNTPQSDTAVPQDNLNLW